MSADLKRRVAEVAERSGISHRSVFRYFADKDELYAAVGHWGADEVMDRLLAAILTEAPVRVYRMAPGSAW